MVVEQREMVHVRLPKSLVREIDHLAVDWDTYRNGAVERLLTWAVEQQRTGKMLISDTPGSAEPARTH
jgi:hypothetical protein